MTARGRTTARWGWPLAVVAALAVGAVAGRATFSPPNPPAVTTAPQTWTVATGAVGTTAPYTAVVTWPTAPLATTAGDGTVTSVAVGPGSEVDQGSTLYTLDLHPVVVARGDVPTFRDLARGVRGDDVRQLQQMLRDLGHLTGETPGTFDARTTGAVRAWQKSQGVEASGAVAAGHVVFASRLPARVVPDPALVPGARLGAGSAVLSAVAPAPEFTVTVGSDQRTAVPATGTPVRIDGDGPTWDAVVAAQETDDTGAVVLQLTGPDGGPACGDACGDVPFSTGTLRYPAQVELQPTVTGPAVPLASLGTAADGTRFVTGIDGDRLPVTVVASDASRAVVEGVDEGTVVQLFAVPDGDDEASDRP